MVDEKMILNRTVRSSLAWFSVLLVVCLSVGVISCGSAESTSSTETSEPIAQDSAPIEIPKLTAGQEARAVAIMEGDLAYQTITEGRNPSFGSVGEWTRTNQELLGAGIEVRFETPGDYEDSEWPSVVNKEDLYGENYVEEGDPGPVEPNIDPEIGTTNVDASTVTGILVMVDLGSGRVAEITPMPY